MHFCNALRGKKLSILGDSISTYAGVSNNGVYRGEITKNAVYYTDQMALEDTYWMQLLERYGMELCVNNSWSGAYVTRHVPNVNADQDPDGSVSSGMARADKLHRADGTQPQVILTFIGINDLNAGVSPEAAQRAYEQMVNTIRQTYPDAQVFCMGMPRRCDNSEEGAAAYNAALQVAVAQAGDSVHYVDLYHSTFREEVYRSNSLDNLHPNAQGMDYLTDCFARALEAHFS